MRGIVDDEFARAISADEAVCSGAAIHHDDCKDLQDPLWFGLLCKAVWPSKPWLMLSQVTGCKERTAHNHASGAYPAPASSLRDMLRSEYGFLALRWLMRHDPPDWWVVVQRHREIGEQVETIVRQAE